MLKLHSHRCIFFQTLDHTVFSINELTECVNKLLVFVPHLSMPACLYFTLASLKSHVFIAPGAKALNVNPMWSVLLQLCCKKDAANFKELSRGSIIRCSGKGFQQRDWR